MRTKTSQVHFILVLMRCTPFISHQADSLCLKHRLLSIQEDNAFVQKLRTRHPSLPVFANLRCGRWYVRPSTADPPPCYFKSADGHASHWAFSLRRLNLQVARHAAERGGCIIIDSTRKGKKFPDSFSKTVPIWCAVLNRALSRLETEGAGAGGADGKQRAGAAERSKNDLFLPTWVPLSEKSQIEDRIDAWVTQLLKTAPRDQLLEISSKLRGRQLRCLWACPGRVPWSDREGPISLDFLPFIPIICASVSRLEAEESKRRRGWHYVQGAGDDEENWARGLKPALFWANVQSLLQPQMTADQVETAVNSLVAMDSKKKDACNEAVNQRPPDRRIGVEFKEMGRGDTEKCKAISAVHVGDTGLAVGHALNLEDAMRVLSQNGKGAFSALLWCTGPPSKPPPKPPSRTPARSRPEDPDTVRVSKMKKCHNFCIVGVYDDKTRMHRKSLEFAIPTALEFARNALRSGSLIVAGRGEESASVCVSVCIAILLEYHDSDLKLRGSGSKRTPVSKQRVKAVLTSIQRYLPGVHPSRHLLKQINKHFLSP